MLFGAAASLRLLAAVPFIVDDDESWWVAASRALWTPWEYYFRAVDHKTPGVVWFYWFLDHALGTGSDPRWTRFLYGLFLAAAALLIGGMARQFVSENGEESVGRAQEARRAGWIAAVFFLVASLAACPKLFSVTADGVMTLFVVAGYAVAFGRRFRWRSVLSGALLGCGILVKQTGVFFAIPILFCRVPHRFRPKEILGFALGSAALIVPVVRAMDPSEFFYWNWTYPREVLLSVRSRLFDGTFQLGTSLLWIGFALWPLFWAMFSARSSGRREGRGFWLRDARALWFLSSVAVMLAGQGLFLHYFVSLMPPLALLATEGVSAAGARAKLAGLRWLAVGYLASCAIILFYPLGILWGTDLPYFGCFEKVLKETIPARQKIMIWGGSTLPLTYSGADFATAFVTPRFGVQPYGSARSHALFVEQFKSAPPVAIVDLSERSDNQFNNRLASEPVVASAVRESYRTYVLPSLPWAKFYFRSEPDAGSGLVPVRDARALSRLDQVYPAVPREWVGLWKGSLFKTLRTLRATDLNLRARQSLELVLLQSQDPGIRRRAEEFVAELGSVRDSLPPPELVRFLDSLDPLPWRSFMWWAELFVVEEQPRALSSPAMPASYD